MKKLARFFVFLLVFSLTSIAYFSCAKMGCRYIDGALDGTFGNGGTVTTDFGSILDSANGVIVLPCGRIVAVGFTHADPAGRFSYALAGYRPYGGLDKQFGTDGTGLVTTDFAEVLFQAGVTDVTPPSDNGASAVALQKNCSGCADAHTCSNVCNTGGKLIVTGSTSATPSQARAFVAARYTQNGILDTTFGTSNSGAVVASINGIDDESLAMALQDDGKIVMVGFTTLSDSRILFGVVRFTCDGKIDTQFGCNGSGMVSIDFGFPVQKALAVRIQKDGKIVVGGAAGQPPASGPFDVEMGKFALVRLNEDGSLDKQFGDRGKVVTSFSEVFHQDVESDDRLNALVLMEECGSACGRCGDANIVAVGFTHVVDTNEFRFALAGYTKDGKLDASFGPNGNGLVVTILQPGAEDGAFAALLQHTCCGKKCKIIVGGRTNHDADISNFTLIRYNANGSVDTTFGNNGVVITDINHDDEIILALTQDNSGRIIAAGRARNGQEPGTGDFALARYLICENCQPCDSSGGF